MFNDYKENEDDEMFIVEGPSSNYSTGGNFNI